MQRCIIGCLGLAMLVGGGCTNKQSEIPEARIEVNISPAPPKTGKADITLTISDKSGQPLTIGNLQVEGNMNHAGMRPSFASVRELSPGTYGGTINFTMGGDWFLLITGDLPGGHRLEKKVDVPGVGAG